MSSPGSPSPSPSAVPPPSPSQNTAIWWVLGILGGGVVILALCGLIFTAYVARQVRVKEAGKRVEISTPAGQIRVNQGGAQDTGLPVYPGARTLESNGANIEIMPVEGARVGVAASKYFTADPLDKVAGWYAERLGPGFSREAPGRKTRRIQGVDAGSADVAFISDNGDLVRIVSLKKRADGVEIGLARIGKQEVQ